MSRVLRKSYLAIIIALVFGVFSASETMAQGPLGQVLNRMDIHNANLSSLQANVTMEKVNVQLGVKDVYTGNTSYLPKTKKRGVYMRLDWTSKPEEHISLIGDDYELYKPSINRVYYGKVNKAKNSASAGNAISFMNMSKEQLKANFEVTYIGEEQISGGVMTWHLHLVPKVDTNYKSGDLWVDGDGMPRQGKRVEMNNDTTTVLLTNIRKNVTLKSDIFKLKYPGNVEKIQA